MRDSIKVGVIGTGTISQFHLDAYRNNPYAEITAICDVNEARAQSAAEIYGAEKVYTDYRELLADPAIEAVSVCTWNSTHAEISAAAVRAGKAVLVEKPLSRTMEEALEVQQAVKETGGLLQVGYVRRYDNNALLVKQFAGAGEFGEFYYAKASGIRRIGNPGGWFADKSRSGGGPVIDIGVHLVDLCWYLMGRPKVKSVSANMYSKLGNRGHIRNLRRYQAADYGASLNTVEDMANALIRFENGASLALDVSFTLHAKENRTSIVLYGDKGGVEIDPELTMITEKHDTILNVTPQTDHSGIHIESAFQNEIDHFITCVRTGNETISPVNDGVEVMKILTAIYESAEKGMEITW
ncbi:oxidoreductase [Paenibacillus yonginensis]|uniref:Oxidoreductase n=1 Tax=Paenibacillus yonginensis TaxID=1462996 RepID=A0A1B1MVN9_9BACL|nr:Gfo/Idh/MocA family oxidoreductase [Paenibacillus yonginensis]ANS73250.1 oxidoreductase [Paenibacillus yonginensis]